MDKIGRKRFGRRFRYAPVGFDAVAHARPELLLGEGELVAEDVAPEA